MDTEELGIIIGIVLVFVAVAIPVFFFTHRFKYWQRRGIPHLPPIIPSGHMQHWMRKKHCSDIFQETYDAYKDTPLLFAGFYFNTQKAVIALDIYFIRKVLVTNSRSFESRGFFHNERNDPLTGNLFLLDGPKWHTLTAKVMPTFTADAMRYIFPTMLGVGNQLHNAFASEIAGNASRIFDVNSILRRYSCDVIGNCVLGLDCDSMQNPSLNFHVMTQRFFTKRRHSTILDTFTHSFPSWARALRMKAIPDSITNYFMKLIEKIAEHRVNRRGDKNNYFDLLLDANQAQADTFTIKELAAQTFVFLMTAYDTCASTLSFALYELARTPPVQTKLRKEIRRTLAAHRHNLTYECLQQMKYLDQVISETLRKYPVMPTLLRKCTERFEPHPNSVFHIEKGCLVIIPVSSIHNDPRYFPNPFSFDPERFATNNERRSFYYFPFGDGPRKCIGKDFGRMQLGIGLVKLISNYRFEMCSKTNIPPKNILRTFNLSPESITLKVIKI